MGLASIGLSWAWRVERRRIARRGRIIDQYNAINLPRLGRTASYDVIDDRNKSVHSFVGMLLRFPELRYLFGETVEAIRQHDLRREQALVLCGEFDVTVHEDFAESF